MKSPPGLLGAIFEELRLAPEGDFRSALLSLRRTLEKRVRDDPYGAMTEVATFGASLAAIGIELRAKASQANVNKKKDSGVMEATNNKSSFGSKALRVGGLAILAGGAYALWRNRGQVLSFLERTRATGADAVRELIPMRKVSSEHESEKEFRLPEQKPGDFRNRDSSERPELARKKEPQPTLKQAM